MPIEIHVTLGWDSFISSRDLITCTHTHTRTRTHTRTHTQTHTHTHTQAHSQRLQLYTTEKKKYDSASVSPVKTCDVLAAHSWRQDGQEADRKLTGSWQEADRKRSKCQLKGQEPQNTTDPTKHKEQACVCVCVCACYFDRSLIWFSFATSYCILKYPSLCLTRLHQQRSSLSSPNVQMWPCVTLVDVRLHF